MKKKPIFVLVFLLCFAMISAAMAQEATVDTDLDVAAEEMGEASIMHVTLGAQVRLLQLEKEVMRRILYGEQVLAYIDENELNISADDMDRLEDIIAEMTEIKDRIISELDNTDSETTVELFVELKDRAINLTQEFRTIIRSQLSVEERNEMSGSIDKKTFPELDSINDQIKDRVMQFNKERAMEMLGNLNITDEEILGRVESGNITAKELRELINSRFRELKTDMKQVFITKVKNERAKIELARHVAFAKKIGAKKEDVDKIREIIKDKNLTSSEMKAKLSVIVREQVNEKKEKVDEIKNRMKEIRETIEEKKEIAEKLRDRLQEKKEGLEPIRERLHNKTRDTLQDNEETGDDKLKARLRQEIQVTGDAQ